MFEVVVSGTFRAAHRLRLLDGSLEPLHDHAWNIRVTCRGKALNEDGLLVDFTVLRPRLMKILADMDGRELNTLPAFAERNPSAENVAVHIADELARAASDATPIASVEAEEEPGCFARYYPPEP